MSVDPWTAPDPEPGDFDAALSALDPQDIEHHDGHPDAGLKILLSVEGEDADRLERLAAARGQPPSEVVADLLRSADRSAA